MNFDIIRSQVGRYETDAAASPVAAQLQTLIARHGLEIFRDTELLNQALSGSQLSKTIKAQLALIFSSSTLLDFILNSKSDLNLVDVDNALHNVVGSTGLSYKAALVLLTDVLYACGLSFAVEYGPQLRDSSVEYRLHALMPSQMVETETRTAEGLIAAYNNLIGMNQEKEDEETIRRAASEAVSALHKLCEAGVPEGFYMLGRCYLYGDCGTKPDFQKALELMQIASDHGSTEAAAALGDVFYESSSRFIRDYTLAHHFYTRPGAMAMGKDRQRALQEIYKQHAANKTTIVFAGLIFLSTIAFLVFFHEGIFSGASRLAVGIVLTVVSGIAYAAGIWYNILKPFNSLRWLVAVQYFIWALYALILVLA